MTLRDFLLYSIDIENLKTDLFIFLFVSLVFFIFDFLISWYYKDPMEDKDEEQEKK